MALAFQLLGVASTIVSTTASPVGIQIFFSSFLISILGLRRAR